MSRDQAPEGLGSKTAIKRRRTTRGVREVGGKQLTLGSCMEDEWSAKRAATWGKGTGRLAAVGRAATAFQRDDGSVEQEQR